MKLFGTFLLSIFLYTGFAHADIPEIRPNDYKNEVLESEIPVVLLFGGEGCPPCKELKKKINKIRPYIKNKVKFVYMDVDADDDGSFKGAYFLMELLKKHGKYKNGYSIPTMFVYKNGRLTDFAKGLPADDILAKMYFRTITGPDAKKNNLKYRDSLFKLAEEAVKFIGQAAIKQSHSNPVKKSKGTK